MRENIIADSGIDEMQEMQRNFQDKYGDNRSLYCRNGTEVREMKRVILCPNPYRDKGLTAAKAAEEDTHE